MQTIRDLFSNRRSIDRAIEKVIDYAADSEDRLAAEIEEYEATDNVEACFRKFIDIYREGVQGGRVTEIGIWVSGFYGSGKSSFTKYLGFALDANRTVQGRPFIELLTERFQASDIRASLLTIAKQQPTAVVMLDLGAEQLADSTAATVTTVLYWKVLQWAGFSKEKKLAQLEFVLERRNLLDAFRVAYRQHFGREWETIHNDPLIGVAEAAQIVPTILPQQFPTPDSFRQLRFQEATTVSDRAREMIELIRQRSGRQNILLLIDEAGQYVAPRQESILDLDGLARSLKELGQGRVWMIATGQQTLSEIVERATYNSAELFKLRDRFPIGIELDARDIREITYRRLLTKSPEGERHLRDLFKTHGQSLIAHSHLTGTTLYRADPDAETFTRFYPYLPQHFDLLLELIRTLARSTGGIGLRSVIRVIQDVLVDTSRVLPPGATKLADRPLGTLARVDDFYDTLRADLGKVLPHVVTAVDTVAKIFPANSMPLRVAKAVAALQPIESFPRTAENLAALLYPAINHPSLLNEVREALRQLSAEKECGLVEDPQSGGYVFLSNSVRPLQTKRNDYKPTGGEVNRERNTLLAKLFEPQPSARVENVKDVKAVVRVGKTLILGDSEELAFRLDFVPSVGWEERRTSLITETATQADLQKTIVWLARVTDLAEDLLPEIVKSNKVEDFVDERAADRDVAQFLRSERKLVERNRERVEAELRKALLEGTLIFNGRPRPASESGATIDAVARQRLEEAAKAVFHHFRLVPIRPATDLAAKFLAAERLDRVTRELDPLALVGRQSGMPRIDLIHPALAETLRVFRAEAEKSGSGRLQGSYLQDLFASAPYGWSKDAVRYLFAALLWAGEIEVHGADGTLRTASAKAVEGFKNTVAFNRVGVSMRDNKLSNDTLDRAARQLQLLFNADVLPLEANIGRAVQKHVPDVVAQVGPLPDRLRLLGLAGEARAKSLLLELTDLLKGDGTGAAAVLGSATTTVPDDVRWAREVARAFEQGAEPETRAATQLLQAVRQLQSYFVGEGERVLPARDAETITQTLASENFHERLADVRGVVRASNERVRARYAAVRAQFAAELQQTLEALQNDPAWLRLSEDDRRDIASQLNINLPVASQLPEPIAELQRLLVHRNGLANLRAQLAQEIERRQAPSTPPTATDESELAVERVSAKSLLPRALISSESELNTWLETLRARVLTLLRANKRVQIEDEE